MKTVIVLDEAVQDLREGRSFYNRREFGLGAYFYDTLIMETEKLSWLHGTHSRSAGFCKMLSVTFPYGIYYRDDHPDCVRVAAILDLRRNPAWIRGQLKTRNRPA